jgi:chemotaxis protein methyltransferase CheR
MTEVGWSDEYEAIVQLLGLRAGLSFQPGERDTVEQAIVRTMEQAGCSNPVEYLRLLNADAEALDNLLAATSIGETYFFRDSGQFRIISDLILPDIRRRRGPGHTIRIWSAGCASGEEAYSLAMLLHRSGALSQATILGTDISQEALSRARAAIYSDSSLRGEGAKMARPYLTEKNGQYYVNPTMRKSVRFETLNLALDNYPSIGSGTRGMDLILCRNELPCFDQQTVDSVVSKLFRSLAEGGWLITAPSDPPILEYEMFDFVPTEDGLAYRKANMSPSSDSVEDPYASEALDVRTTDAVSEANTKVTSKAPEKTSRVAAPRGNKRFAEARQALADGDCQRAADLTTDMRGEGAIIHIKA